MQNLAQGPAARFGRRLVGLRFPELQKLANLFLNTRYGQACRCVK